MSLTLTKEVVETEMISKQEMSEVLWMPELLSALNEDEEESDEDFEDEEDEEDEEEGGEGESDEA